MGRRRRGAPAPLEKAIQAAVVDHWRALGNLNTLVAAIPNQRAFGQPGLTRGLPDLLVIGPHVPGFAVGFIELKRDNRSAVSDDQRLFARLCWELGISIEIACGRDEPIRVLEAWGVVRAAA
jgi:hypothetical protein